jgi:hypothetical protein
VKNSSGNPNGYIFPFQVLQILPVALTWAAEFLWDIYLANKKLNLLNSITRHAIMNKLTVLIGYLELSRDRSIRIRKLSGTWTMNMKLRRQLGSYPV